MSLQSQHAIKEASMVQTRSAHNYLDLDYNFHPRASCRAEVL